MGRLASRGERLIKVGDSWFSAKFIEVKHLVDLYFFRDRGAFLNEAFWLFLGRVIPLLEVLNLRRSINRDKQKERRS